MRTSVWRRAACRCNPSFRSHLHALRPFVWYFHPKNARRRSFCGGTAGRAQRGLPLFLKLRPLRRMIWLRNLRIARAR